MRDPVEALQASVGSGYRIERELGRGGMATVYLAHDLRHGRRVALKLLRPELAATLGPDRFTREIRLAAGLQHPNILTVLDSGGTGAQLWFTMPYVEGESLRSRLDRERQLPIDEAVRLATEVADALECAHRQGIVHRDIKPENILLSGARETGSLSRGQEHALVTDFGIARSSSEVTTDRLTETGMIVGTPSYMSPEQASGERNLDRRTDIYSLGCVLYEMLAGEPPFTGPTAQSIAAKRVTEPVPAISRIRDTVPIPVERALMRAMAKVPADRFASPAEFAQALRQGLAQPAASPPRARAAYRWVGVAAALLLLLLAAYLLRRRQLSPSSGPIPLAVLPFKTFGTAADSSVLEIGIPDAIITRLAGVRQMRLRPTSAVLRYAGKDADVRAVGRELGVGYLVTGTVQAAADRLRVSVQLVRADDATPLWGSAYDLARKDLLTLQDSVAERVSSSLAVRLSSEEHERLYRRYTANPAAYEWYLRGRAQLAHVTEDETKAALESFERALALDSGYALAQAGLAMGSADMHLRFASGPDVAFWGQRANREAARALVLDPNLAEAHLARAAVMRKADFDWEGTLEESGRALALNPNLDLAHYFREAAFYHLGLLDLAEREDREVTGEPADQVERLRTRGVVAFLQGRFDEAATNLEAARRSSSRAYTDSYLAQAYYYRGDTARAVATLDSLSQVTSAPAANRARAVLASIQAHLGDQEQAEALIALIQGKDGYVDHHVAYSVGAAYAQLKQPEEAATWLAKAVETGFPCYPWFERDPLLDPVRKDPRIVQLMAELKQRWEAARSRYS
jgi:serine/threonine-protein kinase